MAISYDKAGQRVEFLPSSDPFTTLQKGALGTVKFEVDNDFTWSVSIDWDCGSSLSMLPLEGDSYRVVE